MAKIPVKVNETTAILGNLQTMSRFKDYRRTDISGPGNTMAHYTFRKQVAYNDLSSLIPEFVSIYPNRPVGIKDNQATDFVGAIIKQETQLTDKFRYYVFPAGKYAIFNHYGSYDFIFPSRIIKLTLI